MRFCCLLALLAACLAAVPVDTEAAWGPSCAPVGATAPAYEWTYPVDGWAYLHYHGRLAAAYSFRTRLYYPMQGEQWASGRRPPWSTGCDCCDICGCGNDCQCAARKACCPDCTCVAQSDEDAGAIECPDPRLAVDLPADLRAWFRNPDGSCVQCSIGMCGVDQNAAVAATLLWDTEYGRKERGGSRPSRVADYAKKRGIRCYNVTGQETWDWMKWACRNGRGAAIGAGSSHFQTLFGFEPETSTWWVCNNNSTGKIDTYTDPAFRRLHLASGQWVVVLDYPAHPARAEPRQWWSGGYAQGQPWPRQVDDDEVRRLGDMVQHINPDIAGTLLHQDERLVQAMALPPDDRDKWHLSVVTMQRCPACVKLKADWKTDPWLRAFAIPEDPARSWAHLNFYDKDDASQSWRWNKLQISGYPTVVLQPPRSGKYGQPETVVFQGGYAGDGHALADRLASAVRRYLATLPETKAAVGQPWKPPPKDDPLPTLPPPAPAPNTIPPPVPLLPTNSTAWAPWATGGLLLAGLLLLRKR